MWNEILLHISRLTDQERVGGGGGKAALTLRRLPPLVAAVIQPRLKERLGDHVNPAIKFARDWRDRYIGHRDLQLVLQETTKPLAPAARQNVTDAISAITGAVHEVEQHYCGTKTAFEFADVPGDAEALLYVIRDGLAARHAKDQRFMSGTALPEDHRPAEPI